MRIFQMLFWVLGMMIGLPIAVHYYLWARLVRDPQLPQPWFLIATVLIVAMGVGIPVGFLGGQALPARLTQIAIFPFALWMGLVFYLLLGLWAGDLVRLGLSLGGFDAGRRLFLLRGIAGAVAAGTGAVAIAGMRSALHRPEVRTVEVPLAKLPRALDGFTIVQLTDIHVGNTIGRDFVVDLVARTNAIGADLIAITGDLIDGSVAHLRDAVDPLRELEARHGVFFVTGNHEYYAASDGAAGANEWIALLRGMDVTVLRNERVAIERDGAVFDLAGVDDWSARQFGGGHGADLQKALGGRDAARELVLLAHQPRQIPAAAGAGVGLVLSGHTHGGQIWPFRFVVRMFTPYVSGLFQVKDTWAYVSRGTGYFGPPLRVAEPSEITKIVLRAG
jgi:predicted MPP superfamily phosphohydrolase